MGCGNTKEKIEDEIMKAKFARSEIQFERQKQLQLLKDIDGCEYKAPIIPDYIALPPKANINQVPNKRKTISAIHNINKSKAIELKINRDKRKSLSLRKKKSLAKIDTEPESNLRKNRISYKKRKALKK